MQNIFGANGSEGPDPGPDPGPAHRCPPRLTDRHTQAVPCHCRFCLWSKNMAGLKVDLVHQVLDITLQFVRTLSTRALLDYFPCSLLGLPWSFFSLSLPCMPEAGGSKVLTWPQDQLRPKVKFPWL